MGRWTLGASVALLLASPRAARAESDPFGLGDGHSGAKIAASAGEVINVYAPLTAAASPGVTQLHVGASIGDAAGFAPNDLILLWTATGEDPAFFPPQLGSWVLARVAAVDGDILELTQPLGAVYDFPALFSQVVKLPEYTSVEVPSGTSLAASPWTGDTTSGFAGGILALFATGAVTLEGNLDADAAGFRGGPLSPPVDPSLCVGPTLSAARGDARVGEGLLPAKFGPSFVGFFSIANAGGGGDCAGNGGGGGGNGGTGMTAQGRTGSGGDGGGRSFGLGLPLQEHLFFGGGGGAGSQAHGLGTAGGSGGGVIFVRAASLAGGGVISANGESAADASVDANGNSDGAGGGGAGGSVVVELRGPATCGTIDARGGDGGNASLSSLSRFVGPGASGGGGLVRIDAAAGGTCPIHVEGGFGIFDDAVQSGSPGLSFIGSAYCFASTQCGSGVCSEDQCGPCSADYGEGKAACGAVLFHCQAGGCVGCDGDFATGTSAPCQTFATCLGGPNGTCGRCTSDVDCTGPGHLAPTCAVAVGVCGVSCTADGGCASTEWCAQGVCRPKADKGQAVPNVPPFDGTCTPESGMRACLAGGCDPASKTCGRPDGDACLTSDQCLHACLASAVCGDCRFDADCAPGNLCDVPNDTCVPGCREVDGRSNCPANQMCNMHDGMSGQCLDVPGAGSDAGSDAGDVGELAGGGCTISRHDGSRPRREGAAAFALAAAVVLRQRRRARANAEAMLRSREEL